MRSLGIARFRLLNALRSADWVYGVALLCAVVPVAIVSALDLAREWASLYTLRASAPMLLASFVLHACVLISASQPLVQPTRVWGEPTGANDLLEAAPVRPGERFIGEALGITAALLLVHAAVLPVLLLQAAASPIPTPAVLWMEAATVATIIFFGIFAASLSRDAREGWSKARGPVVFAVIVLLVLLALALTTRLAAFRDSVATVMTQGSPGAWRELVATVHNPLLLLILVLAICAGAIVYFYRHAAAPAAGELR